MKTTPLLWVIYDGIHNSVFESQVLAPLKKYHQTNPYQPIHLVSFEYRPEALSTRDGIQISQLRKIPFIGNLSIAYATRQLKQLLGAFPDYHLIARGPIAGLICLKAARKDRCKQLTIQARGLLAEEYAYVHKNETNVLKKWFHAMRFYQFKRLETKIYQSDSTTFPVIIEAVSPALKEYLIQTFGTAKDRITIAQDDKPKSIKADQKKTWRAATRTALNIPDSAQIYCYAGSAKSWQCPEMLLDFFMQQNKNDRTCYLLILTQDVELFAALCTTKNYCTDRIIIKKVPHNNVLKYLAACDTGLIFREKNIINWIARPTKALEYQAAGLAIEHNNTIAYLHEPY